MPRLNKEDASDATKSAGNGRDYSDGAQYHRHRDRVRGPDAAVSAAAEQEQAAVQVKAVPEDLERPKPNVDEDTGAAAPAPLGQQAASKPGEGLCRRGAVLGVCGGLLLSVVLGSFTALFVSPELREKSAGELSKLAQGVWPTPPAVLSARFSGANSDPDAAGGASTTPRTPGGIIMCNASVTPPQVVFRKWELPDAWRRVCEVKNSKDDYPLERNWCWVGFNRMCHWNLKKHKSWATFQEWAAHEGMTPPPSDASFSPLEDPELCDRPERGAIRNWTEEEEDKARKWFKDNVAVYVISLPVKGDARWRGIKARLDDLQIWATRVPGVDMTNHGALEDAKKQGWVPEHFNYSRAQEQAYTWKQNMGSMLGTVGCAAAHFKVQMKAVADGSPFAIVMEDDSWPTDDFIPRLWSLVHEELPCDWEVTALLSRCGYGRCVSPHLMRVMPDANEPAWRCYQGTNWGMHAVLYHTSRLPKVQEHWKKTVFNEDEPHCMDVDVALASISHKVAFYAVPAVQDPGFVKETNHRSARWDINQASRTTVAPKATTTSFFVPTVKPGEPWPGAWKFG